MQKYTKKCYLRAVIEKNYIIMNLNDLTPQRVWQQFESILKVPRPSKHEEKMVDFLVEFAQKRNLEYYVDDTKNVIIYKPATETMKDKQSVCLQAHIDMVCDKEADKQHDFLTDPITPIVAGDWLKADKTTLGADDGIGVAAMLAILDSDDIPHGPIECLFTVDEETGLTGAFGLQPNVLKSKVLLNLDSEDDGQIFIGCAGGIDTIGDIPIIHIASKPNTVAYKLSVGGLLGGHSGDDINKGRGNAIKLLNRFISDYSKIYDIQLADFQGGNLRNAIARSAFAVVTISQCNETDFLKSVQEYDRIFKSELEKTDKDVFFEVEKTDMPEKVLNDDCFRKLTQLIYSMPHGVLGMSFKLKGIVETSTNLASVNLKDDNVHVVTSQRSDSESLKYYASQMVENCLLLVGANVEHSDGYPGWTPNPDSHVLKVALDVYKDLFNEDAIFCSIHAGLECGLFSTKYPEMDMISYGPTLRDVHTPEERILIPTVDKFWKMTLEILKRI